MESVRHHSKSHKLYNFDCMWLSQLSLIAAVAVVVVMLCCFLLLSLLLQICWQCCEKIPKFRRCHADCQSCHLRRHQRRHRCRRRSRHDCHYCIRISACINLNVPHATYNKAAHTRPYAWKLPEFLPSRSVVQRCPPNCLRRSSYFFVAQTLAKICLHMYCAGLARWRQE